MFKTGDEVRVKPDLNVEELRNVSPFFVSAMDVTLGMVGKISNNYITMYTVAFPDTSFSGFNYDRTWLEPLKNEVTIEEEGDA